jgi:hypothetical protein
LNDGAVLKVKSNLKFPEIKKDIMNKKTAKDSNTKKVANKA